MVNLMNQYKSTAKELYKALTKMKKHKQKNEEKYCLLVCEYQQAMLIHRQITNYCKARGII